MFDRDVQLLGSDLRQRCDGALTDIDRADHHLDMPIPVHLHDHGRSGICGHCGSFLEHGKTFAAHLAGLPFPLAFFFRLASGPANFLDHSRKAVFGAAAAFGNFLAAHGLSARLKQVHHAEVVGVDAKFLGENVYLAFNRPVGFEVSKTAVSGAENLIGIDGL